MPFSEMEMQALQAVKPMKWRLVLERIGWDPNNPMKIPVPHNIVVDMVFEAPGPASDSIYMEPNTKSNQGQFASQRSKNDGPRCSILRYTEGDSNIVGARTPTDELFALYFNQQPLITKEKFKWKIPPAINNMVLASILPQSLDVAKMSASNSSTCIYDPDQFSGACFSPDENNLPSVRGNLFENGPFTLLGVKSMPAAVWLGEQMLNLARPFFRDVPWNRVKKVQERTQELENEKRRLCQLMKMKRSNNQTLFLETMLHKQDENLGIAY